MMTHFCAGPAGSTAVLTWMLALSPGPFKTVLTFGRCAYGRLGHASIAPQDDEPHATPTEVAGLPGRAAAVSAGSSGCTAAVLESGDAYVWAGRSEHARHVIHRVGVSFLPTLVIFSYLYIFSLHGIL
jgi:hypothetical protein